MLIEVPDGSIVCGVLNIQMTTGKTPTGRDSHKTTKINCLKPNMDDEALAKLVADVTPILAWPINQVNFHVEINKVVVPPPKKERKAPARRSADDARIAAEMKNMEKRIADVVANTQGVLFDDAPGVVAQGGDIDTKNIGMAETADVANDAAGFDAADGGDPASDERFHDALSQVIEADGIQPGKTATLSYERLLEAGASHASLAERGVSPESPLRFTIERQSPASDGQPPLTCITIEKEEHTSIPERYWKIVLGLIAAEPVGSKVDISYEQMAAAGVPAEILASCGIAPGESRTVIVPDKPLAQAKKPNTAQHKMSAEERKKEKERRKAQNEAKKRNRKKKK